MARKKMRSALQRTPNSNIQGSSDGGGASLTLRSLENTIGHEASPEYSAPRNCDQKCGMFTFLSIEPSGKWRIIAVPVQCSDPRNHRSMDDYQLIPDRRSRMRRQLCNRLISANSIPVPDPRSTTSNHSSHSVPADSSANDDSLDLLFLDEKDGKAVKATKSKKARRKERLRMRLLANGGTAEAELSPEEFGQVPSETASECSVLASPENEVDSENGEEVMKVDGQASDKVNQAKVVLSGSSRQGNAGNSRCTMGKENNHPVWQKVQKKDECDSKKVSSAAETKKKKEGSKAVEPRGKEDKKQSSSKKGSGKSKRKHSSASKQGSGSFSSKGPVSQKTKQGGGPTALSKAGADASEESSGSTSPRLRSEAELSMESQVCLDESIEDQMQELCSDGNNSACLPQNEEDFEGNCKQKDLEEDVESNAETALSSSQPLETPNDSDGKSDRNLSSEQNEGNGVESIDEVMQPQPLLTPIYSDTDSSADLAVPPLLQIQPLGFTSIKLDKILLAVHNVCVLQFESEAAQGISGGPVAEFEKLLYACSPEISRSTADLPLERLWKWYEQPGCFGLEVKGIDYTNQMKFGVDDLAFRAYFVPYLSAVQLFGRKLPTNQTTPCVLQAVDIANFTALPLPIYQPADVADSDDVELLFEYFESAQPQLRRPIYEKIQELIRGEGLPGRGAYGDHTKLGSVDLQDLDPRSWYSVAWYPIYRIPAGNFRAAFLTYHSASHLAHRPHHSSNGLVDSYNIVSPPVGLHSYNAQGECWFQMNPWLWNQAAVIPGFDPTRILNERLRTLEEAASAMSRAVVDKEKVRSVNNHPDYEFFVSRHRY